MPFLFRRASGPAGRSSSRTGRPLPVRWLAVLGVVLLGVSACSGSSSDRWQKPGVTEDERDRDLDACRAYADREALRRSEAVHGTDVSGGFGGGASHGQSMAAYEAKRLFKRYLSSCMRDKGYGSGSAPLSGVDSAVDKVREGLRF